MQEIDLLIIGSGPAGLSTALHLLQQDSGWAKRMILVDKASHPRPKLCAGGVTRIGLKTLRDLEIQLPLPIPVVEV
ncbi:FAD-dependent monooxygenase, partial [bacterium]|nr:FAD-dependent monooxygenase [bacterium]